jgi:hypothetical protein
MRSTCSSISFSSSRTARASRQQLAHQVEVALDHRDRVVHLVRDAGGELAHRGELLAAQQLAVLRRFQFARVRSATLASSSAFQRCSAGLVVDGVEQVVQVAASGRSRRRWAPARRGAEVAASTSLHGAWPSARAARRSCAPSAARPRRRRSSPRRRQTPMPASAPYFSR